MAVVKLTDVSGFPEVTAGTYTFEILSGELRHSKAGRPMILWRLGTENEEGESVSLFYNTLIPSPGETTGYGFIKDLVVGVGEDPANYDLDDADPEGTAEGLIDSLAGMSGLASVRIEDDRPNVKILKPKK